MGLQLVLVVGPVYMGTMLVTLVLGLERVYS